MILEYDEDGRIFHAISDPVNPSIVNVLTERGHRFVNLPPIALPDEPYLDAEGNPSLDDDGKPLMITGRVESVSFDWSTDYIKDGLLQARPRLSVPATVELAVGEQTVISGLPIPCAVTVDGEAATIDDGTLEITGDMTGEYVIRFVQWPYVETETRVTIHEA